MYNIRNSQIHLHIQDVHGPRILQKCEESCNIRIEKPT